MPNATEGHKAMDNPPKQKIGICADHGGYALKQNILPQLAELGFEAVDFGAKQFDKTDDYPDFVIPLSRAVAAGEVYRGIAICGSGVGACVAANKVHGVRAALIQDCFSARQGVEDDDMNLICLGGRISGHAIAAELVRVFLSAEFSGAERHLRRLKKIQKLENN